MRFCLVTSEKVSLRTELRFTLIVVLAYFLYGHLSFSTQCVSPLYSQPGSFSRKISGEIPLHTVACSSYVK